MGKVRVQDLARMMGITNQDLVFKLKSIGVRVEGDDAHIDTDIIQAIIAGKKLPHPREVILRDEQAPVDARKRPPTTVATPARRPPANPLRPGRPRTLIQKVEPSIRTLPASERPAHAAFAEDETYEGQMSELAALGAATATLTDEAPEVEMTAPPAEAAAPPAPAVAASAPAVIEERV